MKLRASPSLKRGNSENGTQSFNECYLHSTTHS